MSNERLPECPFCGGEARIVYDYESKDFYVCCSRCFCKTRSFATEWAAILMWKTRKPMERIVERLEQRKNFYENRMGEGIERDIEDWGSVKSYEDAIEIVKGGGEDE